MTNFFDKIFQNSNFQNFHIFLESTNINAPESYVVFIQFIMKHFMNLPIVPLALFATIMSYQTFGAFFQFFFAGETMPTQFTPLLRQNWNLQSKLPKTRLESSQRIGRYASSNCIQRFYVLLKCMQRIKKFFIQVIQETLTF